MRRPVRIELGRRDSLGGLLEDSLRVYVNRFGTFLAITGAIVVPISLIVEGIGLRHLSAPYPAPELSPQLLGVGALQGLITGALVTPGCIHQLLAVAQGREAGAGDSLRAALDAFAPVLAVTALYALAVMAGLVLLVLPGVFLAVRFYVATQAVVIEGRRGTGALRRSFELVRGSSLRVLWVVFATMFLVGAVGVLIQFPFDAAARSADSAAPLLAGSMLAQTLTTPVVALVSTLLFFDLRARREAEGG